MAAVPRKIATCAGKMNGMPGGVGLWRAWREKDWKRQFFRWKKIILVDSRPRICYNKLQILYCIRRAAR